MRIRYFFVVLFLGTGSVPLWGDCPLDHLLIGCNADGVYGTADDDVLFVDCYQKYRHSDPMNTGAATWLNWYYPMYYNPRYDRYQIGEPGFDLNRSTDPNHVLTGMPNEDYRIIVECVSTAPGFSARNQNLGITLDSAGNSFNHSGLSDPHLHLEFRAPSPAGSDQLHWMTFRIKDQVGKYKTSEIFTVVFVKAPMEGDLYIDGKVDLLDLERWIYYYLKGGGSRYNDYYERADINRSGRVDIVDFSLLAANWLN